MSEADILKWNAKYGAMAAGKIEPDPSLVACRSILPDCGKALDLACGRGGNSLYLAEQGFDVTALDISPIALQQLADLAQQRGLADRIRCLQVDLDDYELEVGAYNLVVVMHFLNRNLFPAIEAALRPDGYLVYKTFNRQILQSRPDFNPDYTIQTPQLVSAFPRLEIIGADGCKSEPYNAFIIARKSV